MSDAREAAARVAVLKALRDRISAADAAAKQDVLAVLDAGDRKHAVLPDGTDIGTVTVTRGRESVRVSDPDAFLAWVKANRPTEIVETVRDSFRDSLCKSVQVTANGDAYDPVTGELVPGLSASTGASYVSVRQSPEQQHAVAAAWELDARSIVGLLQAAFEELTQ